MDHHHEEPNKPNTLRVIVKALFFLMVFGTVNTINCFALNCCGSVFNCQSPENSKTLIMMTLAELTASGVLWYVSKRLWRYAKNFFNPPEDHQM
ncbi:Hypothetical protein CINCED_3A004602 [Cinara cedri]|uniref:Uncharacterized protein n=1 Tax=Cinara cedri TaxID=506608 RepID=A0A5E4MTK5_9HEMI|nr:Hypothetical protein CINCED_3A004602 [Cinara cedri]